MSDAPPIVVHEAETQRQHVRIALPARAHIAGYEFKVEDWSYGGVALSLPKDDESLPDVKLNHRYVGKFYFDFDGFSMEIPIELEIVNLLKEKGRAGCRFQNLNRQQQSMIQYFVTAYVSGEIIQVNDILDVAARNNYTSSRKVPGEYVGLSKKEIAKRKAKKIFRASLVLLATLLLVVYIASSVYEKLFIITASSAQVTAEMLTVDTPAGGKVYYYPIKPDSTISIDEPLLTVSTMTGNVLSVDSPCNCIVKKRLLDNNRLARKGEPALELLMPDSKPYVEAYIPHTEAIKLAVGHEVLLSLPGHERRLRGRVDTIQAGKGLDGNSKVIIQPKEDLPISFVDDPVEIRVDTLNLL